MGTTKQSESQALVSEGSRERGRGKGRYHYKGTEKGRWRSQARGRTVRYFYCDQKGYIKRDYPKYKAPDQSSNTAATIVMANENESDVLLATLKDGKHASDAYEWRTTQLVELLAEGGAIVRHESSGISEKNGQGKQPLHRGMQSKRRGTWKIYNGTSGSGVDVQKEAQRKETKLILRSCTTKGAATPKRVFFALDLIIGSNLSNCAHKGGEMKSRQLAKSYGRAGPEAIRMDNLKTSDYPLMGWRGRLLSLAHLDESKPIWMSPNPVAKPKANWSLYGVFMWQ
ncbi:hypothetical protein Acr_15g0011610 [Actinidia rufa]|uniref:Uncharacterized protein n=1 Tax=Actinidia rufa TaxID=165716 RepID=A0A7J0FV43_9ERIC|nr:hypothetical protein Acr_15g0011610 [Actinidia rufa]